MLPATSLLADRHARLRGTLDSLDLDSLVVTSLTNVRYLTNHNGTAGILVVTQDALHLLIDFRYEEAVRELQASAFACPKLRTWPVPASYDEALMSCLAEIAVRSVGFEASHLTVARHEWLVRSSASRGLDISFRSTERAIEELRLLKDGAELLTLRQAAERLAS